ncbi:hypothetical protein LCGC14_3121960, partial [marine sediment metagenome]
NAIISTGTLLAESNLIFGKGIHCSFYEGSLSILIFNMYEHQT